MKNLRALFNSLMGRLLISYIVIILIVCITSYLSHGLIYKTLEERLVKENRLEFENIVEDCEKYLNNVKNHLFYIDMDKSFQRLISSDYISDYSVYKISDHMAKRNIEAPGFSSYWLYHSKSDYCITGLASYQRDTFWNTFYSSERFNKSFWDQRFTTVKLLEILPREFFRDNSIGSKFGKELIGNNYVTLIYKPANGTPYYLFAFIDTDKFLNQVNSKFSGTIHIEPGDRESDVSSHDREEGIYRMDYYSEKNMINYYTDMDYRSIKHKLIEINLRFTVTVVLSIFLCIIISLFFSFKINAPFKSIGSIFESSLKGKMNPSNYIDLDVLKNNIFSLVQANLKYKSEIENRDKRLQKYMFLDKIRNPDIPDTFSDSFHFDSKNGFHLLCIKIHLLGEALFNPEIESSVYSLFNRRLDSYFEKHTNLNMIYLNENKETFVVIYEPKEDPVGYLADGIVEYLDSIRNDQVCFSVLVGRKNYSVESLDKSYDNILMLQEKRPLGANTCVIYEDNPPNGGEHYTLSINDKQNFTASISKGYMEESIGILTRVLESNRKKNLGCFKLSLLCYEMVNQCIKAVIDTYSFLPEEVDSVAIYTRLKGIVCFDDFVTISTEFLRNISHIIGSDVYCSDYIVEYIKKYVQHNYHEEIYLDLFSEKLNVSKVYISRHFKEVTGENLLEYINKYRMEIACDKLKNTDMKIKDIAIEVGVSNINSFIRIFKKYYGKSPGSYRNFHLILE